MGKSKRTHKLTDRRRRMRYAARRLIKLAVVAAVLAALVLADRAGIFGRAPKGDFAAYDGAEFAVVRVLDGDTLDVDTPDGGTPYTRIRLWGVDTPEMDWRNKRHQHFAPQATEFTRKAASRQPVKVKLEAGRDTRDRYGRLLAFVRLGDGRVLNRLLIAEGCGYADPRFDHSRKAEYARVQRRAMKNLRGLWEEVAESDLPYYYQGKLRLPKK
ncbi:MAG: thermonuclease family protein [Phycisphaerae bacterium]|nr:thermonuclease family protein [Phycisphaerae bacterium]